MRAYTRLVSALRTLFQGKELDNDLTEELRSFVDIVAEEKIRAGASPEDAYRQGRIELGGVTQVTERVRERRLGATIGTFFRDIRFAFRTLRRVPAFAAMAVLTLGLGIGAATAMFSVIDGVLLKQLPYRHPDRLVTVWIGYPEWGQFMNLRDDQYRLWRENNTLFEDVAIYLASAWGYGTVSGAGQPQRVSIGTATASPAPVAVVSFEFWTRMFGADPNVLGQVLVLEGIGRTIVGVLPQGFRLRWLTESPLGTREVASKEVWVPFGQLYDCIGCGSSMYQAIGRLKPGVTVDQAFAETRTILTAGTTSDEITVRGLTPRGHRPPVSGRVWQHRDPLPWGDERAAPRTGDTLSPRRRYCSDHAPTHHGESHTGTPW
jgi:hypothetical protein